MPRRSIARVSSPPDSCRAPSLCARTVSAPQPFQPLGPLVASWLGPENPSWPGPFRSAISSAMIPILNPDAGLLPGYTAYLEALRETGFEGEIQIDYATRLVTATDNSVYQILPQAVAFP